MRISALLLGSALAAIAGSYTTQAFEASSGNWTVMSKENKGQGPAIRCFMTVSGDPKATGAAFRTLSVSDFYQKSGNSGTTQRVLTNIVLGPGAFGTEKTRIEGVTVGVAPGEWSVKGNATWFPRANSGTLSMVIPAPFGDAMLNIARYDTLTLNVPAGAWSAEPVSVEIPLSGSAKAMRVFDACRKEG